MRLYDWETRFSRYISTVAREGFAWGLHDCALFAAGGIEAVTGVDPAAEWRGRYGDEAGGMALIRAAGFADHLAAARCWLPEVGRLMIMPGDVAIVAGALGLVNGEVIYVLRESGFGLVGVERASALLAVR